MSKVGLALKIKRAAAARAAVIEITGCAERAERAAFMVIRGISAAKSVCEAIK